jgi:hypothetical protein
MSGNVAWLMQICQDSNAAARETRRPTVGAVPGGRLDHVLQARRRGGNSTRRTWRKPQPSKGQPLKYSERLKTLKSFTKDQPLPNKDVEWLRFKSLALLAVPRKSDGDEADKYEAEMKIEEEHSPSEGSI